MAQEFAPPPSGAPQFQAPSIPLPHHVSPPVNGLPAALPLSPWQPVPPPRSGPPQRPAVIAVACSLAVVASLLWICGLSLLWVTATIGTATFAEMGDNGAVFHILNRFNYRMLDGLAIPLYAFPLASFATGFSILSRRPWTRVLHTAVGVAALLWGAWWLQDSLLWWFSGAWYVVVACLVLWTPAATAWYRWHPPAPGRAAEITG